MYLYKIKRIIKSKRVRLNDFREEGGFRCPTYSPKSSTEEEYIENEIGVDSDHKESKILKSEYDMSLDSRRIE